MRLSMRVALIRALPLLLLPIIASGCAGQGTLKASFPPYADVKAATEAKPRPSLDIATSAQASEDYNAAIEAWGDRVSAAGGRLCRYLKRVGMAVDCPPLDSGTGTR